jgi:hypothetical protein
MVALGTNGKLYGRISTRLIEDPYRNWFTFRRPVDHRQPMAALTREALSFSNLSCEWEESAVRTGSMTLSCSGIGEVWGISESNNVVRYAGFGEWHVMCAPR